MTAHELDQPRMIYTGALPPHLMRAAEEPSERPYAEDDLEPPADEPRPFLPLAIAAGAALTLGIAIGVFAPALVRGRPAPQPAPPPVVQTASLAPEPVARPELAPQAPLSETMAAELQPPLAVPSPAKAAPLRIAVARLAPTRAADTPRRPIQEVVDPVIVAAESDLQHAYQRALSAGTPADQLRSGQIDWLLTRQAAAGRSPADLAGAYRQRIAQLNALADDPPH